MERNIKRFVIEVEEGHTECIKCPLRVTSKICSNVKCAKFNLATMKIKELEEKQ